MQIKLAVADTDITYVERLTYALEAFQNLSLSVYTNGSAFKEACRNINFDVVMFNPAIISEKEILKSAKLPIVLFDEEQGVSNFLNDVEKINKYQSGHAIYKTIMGKFSEISDADFGFGNSSTMFVSVYSISGGCGKTTLALATAMQLSSMCKNVLYVSFEDADTVEFFARNEKGEGLSELFSKLDSKINLKMKLESILHTTSLGISWLSGFDNLFDLQEINTDDINSFMELLSKSELFDVVIIDMGTALSAVNIKILELSEKIIFVENYGSQTAVNKVNKMKAQANITVKYAAKLFSIVNFVKRNMQVKPIGTLLGSVPKISVDDERVLPEQIAKSGMLDISRLLK